MSQRALESIIEGLVEHSNVRISEETKKRLLSDLLSHTTATDPTKFVAFQSKRQLTTTCSRPVPFNDLYDSLKARGVAMLDRVVALVARLQEQPELVAMLSPPVLSPVRLGGREGAGGGRDGAGADDIEVALGRAVGGGSGVAALGRTPRRKKGGAGIGEGWAKGIATSTANPAAKAAALSAVRELAGMPHPVQEAALVDDCLWAVMGVEGRFILSDAEQHFYLVEHPQGKLDPGLVSLVGQVLPLATHAAKVRRFVEKRSDYTYGTVSHALAAALAVMCRELQLLSAQLETQASRSGPGALTLSGLVHHLQPAAHTMDILFRVTSEAGKAGATGGRLLNLLHRRAATYGGDSGTRALLNFLLTKSSEPYLAMLANWLHSGKVNDPYDEFLVEERPEITRQVVDEDYNDSYWEQRYTLRKADKEHACPVYLERFAGRIVTVGKYHNVIRECARGAAPLIGGLYTAAGLTRPELVAEDEARRRQTLKVAQDYERFLQGPPPAMPFSENERDYQVRVDAAHILASQALLNLLREHHLMDRLRSLRRYFFSQQGDFLVHFLDAALPELEKPAGEVSRPKLALLLEQSLRTSVAADDPFKDDLRCDLLPYSLLDQLLRIINVSSDIKAGLGDATAISRATFAADAAALPGSEAFTLDYVVRWPVSLVISRKALTKYQLLFRHLFSCKLAEARVCAVWSQHSMLKELDLRRSLASSYALRQRMLHMLQNMQHYMTFEVLEPNWHILETKLAGVSTVDEVLAHHNDFLDTCLTECLLTNPTIIKIVTKVFGICQIFADFVDRFTRTLTADGQLFAGRAGEKDAGRRRNDDSDDDSDGGKGRGKGKKNKQQQQQRARTNPATERATRLLVASQHVIRVAEDTDYEKTVANFAANFDSHARLLVSKLTDYSRTEAGPQMASLCARLNFNNYYDAAAAESI